MCWMLKLQKPQQSLKLRRFVPFQVVLFEKHYFTWCAKMFILNRNLECKVCQWWAIIFHNSALCVQWTLFYTMPVIESRHMIIYMQNWQHFTKCIQVLFMWWNGASLENGYSHWLSVVIPKASNIIKVALRWRWSKWQEFNLAVYNYAIWKIICLNSRKYTMKWS